MPQYELMYLLASSVADDEVPQISQQIKKFVEDFGGTDIQENQLGKKKLSYPIKRTRNGYYVTVNFSMDSKNLSALDARIHSQDNTIIRYLILNIDEHLERAAKDKVAQSKLSKRPEAVEGAAAPQPQATAAPQPAKEAMAEKPAQKPEPAPLLDLDQEELDKKIEEALNEDLTK